MSSVRMCLFLFFLHFEHKYDSKKDYKEVLELINNIW